MYRRFIAQSSAQGPLRAFHKFKSYTSHIISKSIEHNNYTKQAHYTNVKHIKHNPKVSPFRKRNGKESLGDAGTIDRFDLAFQYQFKNKL